MTLRDMRSTEGNNDDIMLAHCADFAGVTTLFSVPATVIDPELDAADTLTYALVPISSFDADLVIEPEPDDPSHPLSDRVVYYADNATTAVFRASDFAAFIL